MVVLSLSLNKERTKENQPRLSPWEPPASRRFKINGGAFAFGQSPPSAGHIFHPADGVAGGKNF
jgi:hypothetical protein